MGGSWGGEGLLYELLEGTDSEAAVAHLGVRGTLSLHPGGQRAAGDGRIHPWPMLTPARPLPWGAWLCAQGSWGEPSPPCPSLTVGTLSNCTKVAVVPVLPPHQVGSLLPVLSRPLPLLPSRTISLFPVFLGSSALYVCVWGWGWVLAGVGLVGVGKG